MGTLERKEAASAASAERSYTNITGTKTKQLVLDFLSSNPKKSYSVLDMHNILSIPESTLSINMSDLSRTGVVTFERRGKYKYYTLVQRYVPVFRSIFHSLSQLVFEKECAQETEGVQKKEGVSGHLQASRRLHARIRLQPKHPEVKR